MKALTTLRSKGFNFSLNKAKLSFINYSKKNYWKTKVKLLFINQSTEPMRVAVTGGSGNIAYSLAFRIARQRFINVVFSGELLGKDQPVILHLLDLPIMEEKLKGVKMELDDCAFPLLAETVITSNLSTGFKDVDIALLVGSKPRGPGMERGDLLKENGKIFVDTGKVRLKLLIIIITTLGLE